MFKTDSKLVAHSMVKKEKTDETAAEILELERDCADNNTDDDEEDDDNDINDD